MYLNKIILSNYRNILSADLEFSTKINCVCGDNGQGKTNLLDAIYYLSMTKSFVQSSDSFIKNFDAQEMSIFGVFTSESSFNNEESGVIDKVAISLNSNSSKTVRKNGKNYTRLADHIGQYPVVSISPFDTSLVQESGEERRRFINIILSQTDAEYLRYIQSYNKILAQRNKLLKADNPSNMLLEILSEQISPLADNLFLKRAAMIVELSKLTSYYYKILSSAEESVSIEYSSELQTNSMIDLLKKNHKKDLILKYTSSGIHRDELLFLIDGHPLRKCGSQGQQKSFLIALKMAEFALMREIYGFPPILLLDDVFDKLDSKRVENLIKIVSTEAFGQIFITDSNKVRLENIVNPISDENKFFVVKSGEIQALGGEQDA